jgi:hypothetical protein
LLKFSSVPLAAGLVAKTLNNSRDVTNSATQNETFFAVEFTMNPPNISSSHHLHAVGTLFRLATRSLKRISGGFSAVSSFTGHIASLAASSSALSMNCRGNHSAARVHSAHI